MLPRDPIQMQCLLMYSLLIGIIFSFMFPPFSLVGRCLERIQVNKAEGILVVPLWDYEGHMTMVTMETLLTYKTFINFNVVSKFQICIIFT